MMTAGPVLECSVQFKRGGHGRKRLVAGGIGSPPAKGHVPRVSRLMALAIKLDGQIRSGELRDWAEVARLGHVTRARASQLAALPLLAPDIIDAILHLDPVDTGRDPISERDVRPIAATPCWRKQRRMWGEMGREPF